MVQDRLQSGEIPVQPTQQPARDHNAQAERPTYAMICAGLGFRPDIRFGGYALK